MSPWPCNAQLSGKSVTCWKKLSVASMRRVKSAPNAANDRPFVRNSNRKESQAPRDALSKTSKSIISFDVLSLNHDHFSWPTASDTGKIKAEDATLDRIFTTVRACGRWLNGRSLEDRRILMIAIWCVSIIKTLTQA